MIDDETANEKGKNEEINLLYKNLELKNESNKQQLNCDDNVNNNNINNNVNNILQHQQQHHQQQLHHQHLQQQRQINQSPIENRCVIDKESLSLALKYFTSSTLTMRLSGIAQINSYISLFNEYLHQSENQLTNLRQQEGEHFIEWIFNNKIIEHIFGPNLHIEVVKQSQIILNFVVSHLNPQHIDAIWSASQLKHCSKQVFDILMPLIKNMNIQAVLHLYNLLKNLDIKEHSEQTLCLASYLLKFIWTKSFHINEPLSSQFKNQDDSNNVLTKKNFVNIFGNQNFDFLRNEASDDSSVSASMVDDTSEEEDEVTFLSQKDQFNTNKVNAMLNEQANVDSVSSCDASQISLDEENNKQNDDNLITNDVFKERANLTKLKPHQQLITQQDSSNSQQPSNQQSQQELQPSIQQQSFEPSDHPSLTADYLENKNFNLNNSSSESDYDECEINELKKEHFRKERKQRHLENKLNKYGGNFQKQQQQKQPQQQQQQQHNLKLTTTVDEDGDEEMYSDNGSPFFRGMIALNKNQISDDSNSSQFSEKNMADFDGEESDSATSDQLDLDNEQQAKASNILNQRVNFRDNVRHHQPFEINNMPTSNTFTINKKNYLTQQHNSLINLTNLQQQHEQQFNDNLYENEITAELIKFSLENVCKPGQTLLWDLLSDDSIRFLSEGLAQNCEKILFNLICWLNDRRLRMKFIEGCMDNISSNKSVIISLRLLPKLLMSFDHQRVGKNNSPTLTMIVEKERNLLKSFFSNLIQYTEKYKHYLKLKNDELADACSSNSDIYEQPQKIRKTTELSDKSNSPSVSNICNQNNKFINLNQTDSNSNNQIADNIQTNYDQSLYEFFTNMIYTHLEEIQTRLQFLSIIFSSTCSSEQFQLNKEQIDILWFCLAYDIECRDELFNWLLNQARTKEQHALGNELLEYILEKKMPQLTPDSYTMTALDLLQNLSNNIFYYKQQELIEKSRQSIVDQSISSQKNNNNQSSSIVIKNQQQQIDLKELNNLTDNDQWKIASIAIKQLWNIALRAINTDVSMASIRYLNNYYVHLQSAKTLDKEEEFIKQCMDYLKLSSKNLNEDEERHLTIIQRALVLLKTHLETFRCRYSYHFRLMQLNGENTVISHRMKTINEQRLHQQTIKIICHVAALTDNNKISFDMYYNDYVGELRAEVTKWLNGFLNKFKAASAGSDTVALAKKFNLNNLNSDGPIRLLSQGQEIGYNLDEKTLNEMGFKDGQVVYVTMGLNKQQARRKDTNTDQKLPDPPKNKLPFILLLNPIYFDQLFDLLQQLGSMKDTYCSIRAQVLSRRVWEIINLLPTSPNLMKCFKSISLINKNQNKLKDQKEELPNLNSLLDPKSPQKLIYSLQIVDYLQKTSNNEQNGHSWLKCFVDYGGLNHLFDIFISGVLQPQGESNSWNEWKGDCLASLLQLIYQIGINNTLSDQDLENKNLEVSNYQQQHSDHHTQSQQHQNSNNQLTSGNNLKRKKQNRQNEKLNVPQFNSQLLSMLNDVDQVLNVLLTILDEICSVSKNDNLNSYQTGFWGRSQIVHHTFYFLTSWLFSDPKIHINLFNFDQFKSLLNLLVLEDPDPSVRREVCNCLYRLCLGNLINLGNSKEAKIGYLFIPHLLNTMLNFLKIAQSMKPFKNQINDEICYIEKESFGPGCKDYFWLICTLVESLEPDMIGSEDGNDNKVDLEKLCIRLSKAIENQEIRETRNLNIEDESLRGLLCLMAVSLKHNLNYKKSDDCKSFLYVIFDCLFAHPNSKDRNLPKCKQQNTRSAAFDLLNEMVKGCEENQLILIKLLYKQHTLNSHNTYSWDYWPHDDCRSDCGYVGLINLGATCYMASCVQHLFMFPKVRKVILSSKITKNTKNSQVLQELQRMFAFLLESERKAYNPKNFCKVYTMDNQPLNTGEQKDMTEFFTDLISKLEEMSSELKNTLRELFAGTLSNNVVSLDCPHISRTTEEFYTLRCKVADMRNLYDSLDELTVKDTLEGDNMYTCSQCGKKVRAEKRACLKKLPEILCLNTLRYTFNMITMQKEKVNTHFSFPMRIDLSPYLEENLIRNDNKQSTNKSSKSINESDATPTSSNSRKRSKDESSFNTTTTSTSSTAFINNQKESNEYELIGVTVHTGTADGGHYYCFIREPNPLIGKDKWYIFNDAEVHSFDPNQLASECFGGFQGLGEMTGKTYDSVNEKFMDFAIEKTNSAYMLFYKRLTNNDQWASASSSSTYNLSESQNSSQSTVKLSSSLSSQTIFNSAQLNKLINQSKQQHQFNQSEINNEMAKEDSILATVWEDNIQFIKDKYIFDHTYFSFMWQVCASIPQTINNSQNILLPCTQLATAFVIETLIHSKEKPTIANWIELLTKQFNASLEACEWLIDHIADNYLHWPVQILLKCPNQMVRQLFQRLCVHVISELKKTQQNLYLKQEEQQHQNNDSNSISIPQQSLANNSSNQHVVKLDTIQNIESIDNQLPNYGKLSCVTRLIRRLLLLLKCNNQLVRPHLKHLTEYFNLLYEFTKMGDLEVEFMLKMETISIIVQFYLSHCKANGEILEVLSDDEEELSEFDDETTQNQQSQLEQSTNSSNSNNPSTSQSSPNFNFYRNNHIIGNLAQSFKELQPDKYIKPASLDKLINFIAFLTEKSRNQNGKLTISTADMEALVGKNYNFAFLHRQIRDNINLRQTFNLICTLCLNNEKMSNLIINMILTSINRQPEISQPFFIILSMLVELSNTGNQQQQQQQQQSQQQLNSPSNSNINQQSTSSIHSFSNNIYPKIWEIAVQNPLHTLEWLTAQVPRNLNLHNIILKDLNKWMETFLIANDNQRVRHATASLIISLVPNNLFRQTYKAHKNILLHNKENLELNDEAIAIVRKIFTNLLGLLKNARQYADIAHHGTSKLTSYFALMYYCLLSKKEKLMLVPYFNDLWNLFQPRLSEPAVPINQNKQALLYFWYHACIDCPENVECIIEDATVTKNIAFNYILADHDDQDVVLFNRIMLPSYYGLLSLCCVQSREFTRQLAVHQNIMWAFKNITPYYTQYQTAVNELFKLMRLFIAITPETTEKELEEIKQFKRSTLLVYLNQIDPRSCWTTTITAFSILLENDEDRIFTILNNGINCLFQSFNILFIMFHEATACHITNEIVDILRIISSLLSTLFKNLESQPRLREYHSKWKDHSEYIKKPIHLLNSFTPAEVRLACLDLLLEFIQLFPKECIPVTAQILGLCHLTFQDQYMQFQPGPFWPKLGQNNSNLSKSIKSSLRPSKPVIQMHFHNLILHTPFGTDKTYDNNLKEYFSPYYNFIANMCRIANEQHIVNQELVGFCSMIALESLPMRINTFPVLWLELINSGNGDDFINMLCNSCNNFRDYINLILVQDLDFLQNDVVYDLVKYCLPKINPPIITSEFLDKLISIDFTINLSLEDKQFLRKFLELSSYLKSLLLVLSNESALQIINDEQKSELNKIKNKLLSLNLESNSSSSDTEMPNQKRRKSNDVTDDNSKVDKNNLSDTKNKLRSIIGKLISDLVKLLNFNT